jgi:hypothetical protein
MSCRSRPHITAIFVDGVVVSGIDVRVNSEMYEQSLCWQVVNSQSDPEKQDRLKCAGSVDRAAKESKKPKPGV